METNEELKRTPDEVDQAYREAKRLISEGKTISEAIRLVGIASTLFYARRRRDVDFAYQPPVQRKTKVI